MQASFSNLALYNAWRALIGSLCREFRGDLIDRFEESLFEERFCRFAAPTVRKLKEVVRFALEPRS